MKSNCWRDRDRDGVDGIPRRRPERLREGPCGLCPGGRWKIWKRFRAKRGDQICKAH